MLIARTLRVQIVQDAIRKLLAELHAPLVEGIDIPDNALHEYLVLVQRNQFAQSTRRQFSNRMELVGLLP